MHFLLFVCFALLTIFLSVSAFNSYHRDKHGMLGLPVHEKSPHIASFEFSEVHLFDQKLDHFDPTNTQRWKQRYFQTFDSFDSSKNSPIFLQLGGEGEANPIWLQKGQIAENYAPKFQAASILLEHRYYGKSHPTKDMSVDNLRYLSSEQALQDAATFIEFFKNKYKLFNNKWIVFGGSYSGGLAAWMRLKYPHLVAGAVASSAPVNAILNFEEYLRVVDRSLGNECTENIRQGMRDVEKKLQDSSEWKTLTDLFALCSPLDGSITLDVQNFVQNLASNFEGIVQYNGDNRAFEGDKNNITIDTICSIMNDKSERSIDRLAKVNSIILQLYNFKCLDYEYDKLIKGLRETSWEKTSDSGARLWTYQTCTEFGYFQSSDAPEQPFGRFFPENFFVQQCIDIFGEKFNKKFIQQSINETNSIYGSTNLQVTNVIFPNGLIDPWHALGILEEINPSSMPLIIPETAHCADLYPSSNRDSPSLKKARKTIVKAIASFLE